MITQVARRAETAANELLAAIDAGAASCDDLREVLRVTRSVAAVVASVQTSAAELIARRERHGDDGAEVLASVAGLAQRDARDRVKVAQIVRKVPELNAAVQSGEVSHANAQRLVDAITKTSSEAVAGDAELLKQASLMRPEQFVGTANRWIASQQGDNGVSEHARQYARRYLKFYDTPEGMIALHGEFDKITGQRLHNRLRQTAVRLFNADKQLPESERRKFPQCMADALQHQTSRTHSACGDQPLSNGRVTGSANSDHDGATDTVNESETAAQSGDVSSSGWVADITVLARVDDTSRDLIYELSDGSRLPTAVVEELTCNARLTGLVYGRNGDALWRTRSRRTVSETQWQALLANYGGCFHCGAAPDMCQAHHITAFSRGGATSLDNLIMVCWNCHHRIHHDNWQIHKHEDGSHTLHPPQHTNQPRHGPAHAEDWPPALPASDHQAHNPTRFKHKIKAKPPNPHQPKLKSRNLTQSRSNINARAPAISQKERVSQARDPTTPTTL